MKEALLAYHHSCSLRGRLLIKHKSMAAAFPENSRGAISLHSPSAMLQSTSIFSVGEELLYMSGALVFVAAAQGIPLNCLVMVARELAFLGPVRL